MSSYIFNILGIVLPILLIQITYIIDIYYYPQLIQNIYMDVVEGKCINHNISMFLIFCIFTYTIYRLYEFCFRYYFGPKLTIWITNLCLENIKGKDYTWYLENKDGNIIEHYNSLISLKPLINTLTIWLIPSFLSMIISIFASFYVLPYNIAQLVCGYLILYLICFIMYFFMMGRLYLKHNALYINNIATVSDVLNHFELVQVHQQISNEQTLINNQCKLTIKLERKIELITISFNALVVMATVVINIVAMMTITDKNIFMAAIGSLARIQTPVFSTLYVTPYIIADLYKAYDAFIFFKFKEKSTVIDRTDIQNFNLKFDNITLKIKNKIILDGINLEIPYGEKVAIVGHIGSGKSSLIRCFLNLYKYDGLITAGGVDISKSNINDSIGYIPQSPSLFSRSIFDNIVYGTDIKSLDKIKEITSALGIDEFIMSLPNKYNYVLSDGNNLSGGQKQLICIAREILRKPKILLLDEFTNQLNGEMEQTVLNIVFKLDCTIITAAHRESILQYCDRIIRFSKGRIID